MSESTVRAIFIRVRAKPNSRLSMLEQDDDGTWRAHLKAAPVDGKANEELVALVAERFRCRKSAVSIRSGGSRCGAGVRPDQAGAHRAPFVTAAEALAFIRKHGVVLVSAHGPVPRLTDAIAGEPVQGSWWAHRKSREIFHVLQAVSASDEVLVCRVVDEKMTLVHRRLWPALVRVALGLPKRRVSKVRQQHTATGRHVNRETPFPDWVPAAVKRLAARMSEAEALAAMGGWMRNAGSPNTRRRDSAEVTRITVRPLTPSRWADLETVFNARGCSVARGCWCMFYRHSGTPARPPRGISRAQANRAELKSLADSGRPPGLIGYRAGEPVGWVSLGPREQFRKLENSPIMKPVDDEPVWAIVCFVVPAPHRGQGIAHALLDGAIAYARRKGARLVEAYPVDKPGRADDDAMWFGAKSMYDRAGFTVVARRRPHRPIVRLELARPR